MARYRHCHCPSSSSIHQVLPHFVINSSSSTFIIIIIIIITVIIVIVIIIASRSLTSHGRRQHFSYAWLG